jgi:hypothetical protein
VKSSRARQACSPAISLAALLGMLLGVGLLPQQNAYADAGAPGDRIVFTPNSGTPAGTPQQLSGSSTVVIRGTRPAIPKPAAEAPVQAEAPPVYRNPTDVRDPYGSGLNTDFNFEGLSFNPPQ